MSCISRGRDPLTHAVVILTAVGLDQQPGDPRGACAVVAEALGLTPTPPPPRTNDQIRNARSAAARRARERAAAG